VEILSTDSASTDDVTKRYSYARLGIPQYWIVDPKARQLAVMLLRTDRPQYRYAAVVRAGGRGRPTARFRANWTRRPSASAGAAPQRA
jgi:hypothetical protein